MEVMDRKFERFPLTEEMVSIAELCLPALEFTLKNKFNCLPIFHGLNPDAKPHPNQFRYPAFAPEKRFHVQLTNGLQLSVWKDDLTTHKVDAVVNAANGNLQHAGGLAQALCDAGGPEIQKESDNYTSKNGPLSTGDVTVTNSGWLPCMKIIHAVGPSVSYNPLDYEVKKASPFLERAVKNILMIAQRHNLQSIAIPALSSGLFNFPLAVCADIIVLTIMEFDKSNQKPLEVRLVNNDEPSVSAMERACRKMLQPLQASYSHVLSRASEPLLKINNVKLNLKRGLIQEEKSDAIVNTISPERDLSIGEISKAIFKTAGKAIQSDVYGYRSYGDRSYGDIIETKGHGLSAKYVFHAICRRKETGSDKILRDIIFDCLSMAQKRTLSSISFPAIGTGVLKFGREEVAKIMIDTAVNFAQINPETCMDIHFVIYPEDKKTYKVFDDKLKSVQGGVRHSHYSNSSTQGFQPTSDHRDHKAELRTGQPYIELTSAFEETTREAKAWIVRALFTPIDKIIIQNNFIQHFGQREYTELVNVQQKWNVSIDESFDNGLASIVIIGAYKNVNAAGLEVECMCCKVQEEFAREEQSAMAAISISNTPNEKKLPTTIVYGFQDYKDRSDNFLSLTIVRVDKVENPTLKELFELKKKQLNISSRPRRMYQCLPAHFCTMVHRIGFQREYAPPDTQNYGDGIYFAGSVGKAMKLWKNLTDREEYLYFVEAQVLEGRSTVGSRGLIVPPSPGLDPLILYDSLYGDADTVVIFNGHQALPEYVITCKRPSHRSQSHV